MVSNFMERHDAYMYDKQEKVDHMKETEEKEVLSKEGRKKKASE
jgi:hypothetical protein